jgi:hypothetical protein
MLAPSDSPISERRAVLSRYVSLTRGSARSIWSLPSRNVLLIGLCVTTFRHALKALRTRFLFPLSGETPFCVSLLSQGQMGVARWAGWAVILVAALVITSVVHRSSSILAPS